MPVASAGRQILPMHFPTLKGRPGRVAPLAVMLAVLGWAQVWGAAPGANDRDRVPELLALAQSADKAVGTENRLKVLSTFMEQSAALARANPDLADLWVARGAAALELQSPPLAREAAQALLKLPPNPEIRHIVDLLDQRGWTREIHIRTQLPPGPAAPKGKTIKLGDNDLKLRWVEAGSFKMGSSAENPQGRLVHISRGFWLGETEVTQAQWTERMGLNPSNFQQAARSAARSAMTIIGDDRPVEQVSWLEATAFCQQLTVSEREAGRLPEGYEYRLPTEAEWEYAARAGSPGDYVEKMDRIAWCDDNADDITHDVGGKKANAWGFRDMAGNVAEWCYDFYQEDLGRGEVTDWAVLDRNPDDRKGGNRIIRGGSWINVAPRCQPSYRVADDPNNVLSYVGFRVALAPVVKKQAD